MSVLDSRLQTLQTLKDKGIEPFAYTYKKTHVIETIVQNYKDLETGAITEDRVCVAGRIMAMRNTGMFIDLKDPSTNETLQIFSHKANLDADQLELLTHLDIGDVIGVEGIVRRTPRGELTVNSHKVTLLTKSLQPLPEKYHGLQDVETRYRQRYVDLIMNDESGQVLRKRSRIIQAMRGFLLDHEFLEVETPMLHTIAGGASAKPFVTHHNALDMDLYLRIAPELHLKRLIVGGLSERVFEINRCFRNEGLSVKHNPEFTTVELYQAYADYNDLMDLAENMLRFIAESVFKTASFTYKDHTFDLSQSWRRVSMTDLIKEITGVDFLALDEAGAVVAAKNMNVPLPNGQSAWGHVVQAVFDEKVEHTLIQPTHVIDIPKDVSPLARAHQTDDRLTERFESFINGWEVANAFTELNDPIDQLARFKSQMAQKDAGDEEAQDMDEDFVMALRYGMPPTGGFGLGIDRLTMLLTGALTIRDVIAFPTMRPKN
jgi:lysyl-tRNA synthetase class 2